MSAWRYGGLAAALVSIAGSSALLSSPPSARAQSPAYHLVKTVPLGAPDRWDYVVFDQPTHRVYVAHGDRVSVVDGLEGRVVGEVRGTPGGSHGVAISHTTGKGYTDDGKAGVAVAFDLASLKVLDHVQAEDDADAIALDPLTGHVFIMDGDPADITVIDPKTDTVTATIKAGGKIEYAVADGQGHLYVNGEEKREILSINTRTNAIDGRWPIPRCESPHGLAIDKETRRLFASCVNTKLLVVNADTGAVIADLPIGRGSDAVTFDPQRKRIFSSDGVDGVISIIQEVGPDTFTPRPSVKTAVSGRTMAVDPVSGRLFIAASAVEPNATPGGRPTPKPGTLSLMIFDPTN
jgi:YVTN family beta-propeller protein